jgi:hypothetical protein
MSNDNIISELQEEPGRSLPNMKKKKKKMRKMR